MKVKVWLRPGSDVYHATPYCPAIPVVARLELEMSYTARASALACTRCCPAHLYYALRNELRRPTVFHTDDTCSKLPFEHRSNPDRLGAMIWPDWMHREAVVGGEDWERCSECIPDSGVLYSLGDFRRPNAWAKVGAWIEPGGVKTSEMRRRRRSRRKAA